MTMTVRSYDYTFGFAATCECVVHLAWPPSAIYLGAVYVTDRRADWPRAASYPPSLTAGYNPRASTISVTIRAWPWFHSSLYPQAPMWLPPHPEVLHTP